MLVRLFVCVAAIRRQLNGVWSSARTASLLVAIGMHGFSVRRASGLSRGAVHVFPTKYSQADGMQDLTTKQVAAKVLSMGVDQLRLAAKHDDFHPHVRAIKETLSAFAVLGLDVRNPATKAACRMIALWPSVATACANARNDGAFYVPGRLEMTDYLRPLAETFAELAGEGCVEACALCLQKCGTAVKELLPDEQPQEAQSSAPPAGAIDPLQHAEHVLAEFVPAGFDGAGAAASSSSGSAPGGATAPPSSSASATAVDRPVAKKQRMPRAIRVGDRVRRRFGRRGYFTGVVVDIADTDEATGERLFAVVYTDGDREDLSAGEVLSSRLADRFC